MNDPDKKPRRPRYRGTHPRRFAERYKELAPDHYPGAHEQVRARGQTPAGTHVPVLVSEVLQVLAPRPGEVLADCTLGHGGHALALWERLAPDGRVIGFDVDRVQLARTGERLRRAGVSLTAHRAHFAGLGKTLREDGIAGYDMILADLGCSSMQLDDPERGFSYKHEGPLDMRMDDRLIRTAADLLRDLDEAKLSAALRDLGGEPDHAAIAARIASAKQLQPITTTAALRQLVLAAKGITQRAWREQALRDPHALHPAARSFQALRILVNDERRGLEQLLRAVPHCLAPGGRVAIISFHSGEDDRVATAFQSGCDDGIYAAVADHAMRPGPAERRANPRSSSARLRWARRSE